MSPGPRIAFTRFLTGGSPKLVPWIAHLRQVVGEHQSEPLSGGAVVWQLVTGNNRELARSVVIAGAFEDAAADAQRLLPQSNSLEVQLVSQPTRGAYGWFFTREDVPVVTCARWYFTTRDRRQSIELALRCLPVAEMLTGARLAHPSLMEPHPASVV